MSVVEALNHGQVKGQTALEFGTHLHMRKLHVSFLLLYKCCLNSQGPRV